ncbi:Annexin [Corchorus olitorius]|uniref:Annexin n=1 Tax=Corchorus olitorius TaxID=93759 RepID=A0A1R3KJU1_9ROSI|nr:Annexin [Corchorus olitorius]
MEEDIAAHVKGSERKHLVALVSAYKYEGPKVHDHVAKCEAEILATAVKNGDRKQPIEEEEVIMILATRSKPHLQEIYQHYHKICGKSITELHNYGVDEDEDEETVITTVSIALDVG